MDYLWAGMLLIGIFYGAVTGNLSAVNEAILSSGGEALSLCITTAGVLTLWTGLMEAARSAGLIGAAAKRISPLISFLFPELPKDHPAAESISMNFIANFLGLNWGATPAGLKAMEDLAALEAERKKDPRIASDEMCTFLIMNISSLQLIPINMIAYRRQYGSTDPAAIIGPAIAATFFNTLTAILFCRGIRHMNRRKAQKKNRNH